MRDQAGELVELGRHLSGRRAVLLQRWRALLASDPELTSGLSLSPADVNDHIPALLSAFEKDLAGAATAVAPPAKPAAGAASAVEPDADAHGLRRWQQGYDVREVARELGRLNECLCAELDAYAAARPALDPGVMAEARQRWARAHTAAICGSISQYHRLHAMEAAGHIEELDAALDDLRELEQLRSELWKQAAHDLRGNVAVVVNATAGLAASPPGEAMRRRFLDLLQRNVAALGHLLNDVGTLARLQAGEEQRVVAPFDAATLLRELCHGSTGIAQGRGLTLECDGSAELPVAGDAVKVRRIAQNLVLNALAYTREGGVRVQWGDSDDQDPGRWLLVISDTGPGLRTRPEAPLASALRQATSMAKQPASQATGGVTNTSKSPAAPAHAGGEGLGLSIVKRLCELLDAAVEVESRPNGTTFRIRFPRRY